MSSNLSRYQSDISNLVALGGLLLNSMQYEQRPDDFRKEIKRQLGEKADAYLKAIPVFPQRYQEWYSESKALIRQIIPDRLADFVKHYERQQTRKQLQWDNYTIEDYLQNLSSTQVPMRAGIARMEQQIAILRSAEQRFKSSLFDIRQMVSADVHDSEIEAAKGLAKAGYLRAAGAVAGVVLEAHLTQVVNNRGLKIAKKNPTIGDLNDLLKNAEVVDIPRWREIQFLADIRNLCDHHKAKEPTVQQLDDLLAGISKVLKTLF